MVNSIAYVLSKNTYPDAYQAKLIGVEQGTQIVYAKASTLSSGNVLYADSRLTQPIYGSPSDWYGVQLLTNDSVRYAVVISTTGSITPIANPTTTTTTSTSTTTAAPATTTTTVAQTTTTSSSPTTSTTTQAVPLYYIRFNSLGDQLLVYRDYDVNPNVYNSYASSSSFRVYFSGTLEIGTQLFFDQAFTEPVLGNYTFSYTSTPSTYSVNANDVFYSLEGSYITGIVGVASALAWNSFGSNPSLPLRLTNGVLIPCEEMNQSNAQLAPGVTSFDVGVTVYSSGSPISTINYISYNGIINFLNGGSVITSQESC
jgi:hypothetical protein